MNRPTTVESLTVQDTVGQSVFSFLNPEDHARIIEVYRLVAETGEPAAYEVRGLDGFDSNWYSARVGPVLRDGEVVELLLAVTNITKHREAMIEHEALRAELASSRRLESLGRLAGGIAHDFNNLLTVIQGHVDVLTRKTADTSIATPVREIAEATGRATRMTRQLLAFSRHQELEPRDVQLNDVVAGVYEMLSRLLGDDVELVFEPAENLGFVYADALQMERVVVNLATNGRDAMSRGGRLVIRTRELYLHKKGERAAGSYILIDVIDNGDGIDEETQERMFEPFFTTKVRGEGTGLGLATVHGIVRQSGGTVEVASEREGTRVSVLLPKVEPSTTPAPPAEAVTESKRGREQVLLVEDSPAVRRITQQILEEAGYVVRVVDDPRTLVTGNDVDLDAFQLLFTDVVMPTMQGPALAHKVLAAAPHMRVMLTSGYTDEPIREAGLPEAAVAFLPKPFTAESLLHAVRELLDR